MWTGGKRIHLASIFAGLLLFVKVGKKVWV